MSSWSRSVKVQHIAADIDKVACFEQPSSIGRPSEKHIELVPAPDGFDPYNFMFQQVDNIDQPVIGLNKRDLLRFRCDGDKKSVVQPVQVPYKKSVSSLLKTEEHSRITVVWDKGNKIV